MSKNSSLSLGTIINNNTKNSVSFKKMFALCSKLKTIDISKFNSSKCENIIRMFYESQEITEVNMINWNMNNIKNQKNDYFSCPFLSSPIGGLIAKNPLLGVTGAVQKGAPLIIAVGANKLINGNKKSKERENISGIDRLFFGCKKLKYIKMKTKFNEIDELINTNAFYDISESGLFVWKKEFKYNEILNKIPYNWNKKEE